MNVEEMLRELIKYARETTDVVKVDKMTKVAAGQIERHIRDRQIVAMSAQMSLIEQVTEGHA